MKLSDLRFRRVRASDRARLARFSCSRGSAWETLVESQIRGPLTARYLAKPPYFDGRMLLALEGARVVAVGAHHIEPTLLPDVGYIEVIAVSTSHQGQHIVLAGEGPVSVGELMLRVVVNDMRLHGRHPNFFARVDRRNQRSLALLDRFGMVDEQADPDPSLIRRWGKFKR